MFNLNTPTGRIFGCGCGCIILMLALGAVCSVLAMLPVIIQNWGMLIGQ